MTVSTPPESLTGCVAPADTTAEGNDDRKRLDAKGPVGKPSTSVLERVKK
jgi:hypothetical protein